MCRLLLNRHLLLQPEFEALIVDESDTSITLAGVEQWVCSCLVSTPAYFALDITALTRLYHSAIDFNGLFGIEIIIAIFIGCGPSPSLLAISLFHR